VLHRIEKSEAEHLLTSAGFEIDAESDMLRNPEDEHTKSVFDESIRRRTDRFVIRAIRPY
jgi:predicted methyltransferase